MENSKIISFIFYVLTIIYSIGSINCQENKNQVPNQSALFVFGDSLFDVGNNNYINTTLRANFRPYGQTTFKFPTGRVSDGRLIPDFIAEFARLPSIPPNLQPNIDNNQFKYGLNFASAGAGALAGSYAGLVIDLGTQLNSFKNVERSLRSKLGDVEAKKIISRAVYLFHIGSNDLFYYIFSNSAPVQSIPKDKYVDFVIGNTTSVVKEVYKMGGRKFGFMTAGAYDCAPAALILNTTNIGTCYQPVTEMIDLYNNKYPVALRRLERELSGFKYALHDYHTSFLERINNPSKFGFKVSNMACCGSGPLRGNNTCGIVSQGYMLCDNVNDYMFFDPSHMTEKAYRQFAELIWNGPPSVTSPNNLKALFEST